MAEKYEFFREDPDFQFYNMNGQPRSRFDEFGGHRTERDLMEYRHDRIAKEICRDTIGRLGGRE